MKYIPSTIDLQPPDALLLQINLFTLVLSAFLYEILTEPPPSKLKAVLQPKLYSILGYSKIILLVLFEFEILKSSPLSLA